MPTPDLPIRETKLPNGETIAHLNDHETKFLYDEIYSRQVYLKHVPALPDDAVLVDVGANIGLFARFMCDRLAKARAICFEPAPQALALLRRNVERYGERVRVVGEGVADKPGTATFTYYPNYSIMSGFHAESGRDKALLKRAAARQLEQRGLASVDDRMLETLVGAKVEAAQSFACTLNTLSHHIDRLGLARIDLLKVDVERAELAVLQGVETRHWPIIGRVIAEVHDEGGGELGVVEKLLHDQGFTLTIEAEDQLQGAGVFSVFAWRA